MPVPDEAADEDSGKEHDVLIRCTKGDTKFSSRVSHHLKYTPEFTRSSLLLLTVKLAEVAGGRSTLTTQIPSSRLFEFHTKYGSLLKASLAPHMRKRDKKKEKARAEAAANKKREVYVDVAITGKKRGAGHRQRVSRVTTLL